MIFFLKRAFQDINAHRFLHLLTIITIALSILIVSAFCLFFINSADMMDAWKKGIRIIVYLKHDVTSHEIDSIRQRITALDPAEEITFISKQDALQKLKAQLGTQTSFVDGLKENPLPDAFEVFTSPELDWITITSIAKKIAQFPGVSDVEYGQKWLGSLTSIFQLFKIAAIAMGMVFFMASVFIVANTIRLLFFSRHDEFEIMRLVGASEGFIKAPFYIEGIIQGAVGGLLGLGVLFIAFLLISSNLEQGLSAYIVSIRFLPAIFIVWILFCSMFAGWLGCYLSLKQFLNH